MCPEVICNNMLDDDIKTHDWMQKSVEKRIPFQLIPFPQAD
jgi:hypothetical protein